MLQIHQGNRFLKQLLMIEFRASLSERSSVPGHMHIWPCRIGDGTPAGGTQ